MYVYIYIHEMQCYNVTCDPKFVILRRAFTVFCCMPQETEKIFSNNAPAGGDVQLSYDLWRKTYPSEVEI